MKGDEGKCMEINVEGELQKPAACQAGALYKLRPDNTRWPMYIHCHWEAGVPFSSPCMSMPPNRPCCDGLQSCHGVLNAIKSRTACGSGYLPPPPASTSNHPNIPSRPDSLFFFKRKVCCGIWSMMPRLLKPEQEARFSGSFKHVFSIYCQGLGIAPWMLTKHPTTTKVRGKRQNSELCGSRSAPPPTPHPSDPWRHTFPSSRDKRYTGQDRQRWNPALLFGNHFGAKPRLPQFWLLKTITMKKEGSKHQKLRMAVCARVRECKTHPDKVCHFPFKGTIGSAICHKEMVYQLNKLYLIKWLLPLSPPRLCCSGPISFA